MAPFNFSNLAQDTTLAAPLGAADLSMTVATASGYPAVPFKLTISPADPATQEIVVVTDTSGAPTLTITRAADGTTAQAHAAGAAVIHAATAEDLTGLILGGREVSSAPPSAGQAPTWDGAQWAPGAPTPAAHASTHGAAGSDPIALAQSQVSGLVVDLADKVSLSGAYADPAWLTALAWAKLTGVPATFAPSAHASTHAAAGSDPVTLSQSQVSGLVAALAALVPQSRTLTINGVALDLSADRSWTVAGGLSGSGTTGRIPEWSGSTALGDSTLEKAGAGVLTLYRDAAGNFGIGPTYGSVTSGNNNIAVGSALAAVTSGYANVAFGVSALAALQGGYYNIAYGLEAGLSLTSGAENILMGYRAGATATTTNRLIAIGTVALESATGNNNVAIGYQAGRRISTGPDNLCIGSLAGNAITTAGANVFIGSSAGNKATSGSNVGVGAFICNSLTSGQQNVGIGSYTLLTLATGSDNIAIGYNAVQSITGSQNLAIGTRAGHTNSTGSRNIFIGYNAGYNETGSDKLYIEPTNSASPLIYGDFASDFVRINGSFELAEISTPVAPSNTHARDFARDNAGVTERGVRFATGDAIIYAKQGYTVPTYTPSGVTTRRTFDPSTVTLAELADVVGTLIADFKAATGYIA